MVLDHIYKSKGAYQIVKLNPNESAPAQIEISKEQEREIKESLQKEINKLIFQKNSENISAVREVSEKESRRVKAKIMNRDKSGLTSMHHMAAEATVRKMRAYLNFKKGIISSQSYDTESNADHSPSIKSRKSSRPQSKSSVLGFGRYGSKHSRLARGISNAESQGIASLLG